MLYLFEELDTEIWSVLELDDPIHVFILQQYVDMEKKVQQALSGLTGEHAGKYYPLKGMTKDVQNQLIEDHFLFKEGDRLAVGNLGVSATMFNNSFTLSGSCKLHKLVGFGQMDEGFFIMRTKHSWFGLMRRTICASSPCRKEAICWPFTNGSLLYGNKFIDVGDNKLRTGKK